MKSYYILIKGRVQGVGFRPFVYNLANDLNLKGEVKNSSLGVEIKLKTDDIELFIKNLQTKKPPLTKITEVSYKEIDEFKAHSFEIVFSKDDDEIKTLLLPDMAICEECKKELYDKTSKRYKYPFINCTNCGVRYSIIKNLPYDRAFTSMSDFVMCEDCKKEYNDPKSRMFHAQPIGCNSCGVKLELITDIKTTDDDIFENIASLIKQGYIGAIKGVGGFHLVCDATNDDVLKRLREEKHRPTKPFALMCEDIKMAKKLAQISKKEEEVLTSIEAPIVLLDAKKNHLSKFVAPTPKGVLHKIGIMIVSNPFYILLYQKLDMPIVATSANISGEPIIIKKEDIEKKLSFVDFIVDYNREIVNPCDDSVVSVVDDKIITHRLSRGYAPLHLQLPKKTKKKLLSLGANQKSTISIAFENNLILSPHIADLDSIKSIEHFKNMVENFKRFYKFDFDEIICDLHPFYESTKYALSLHKPTKQVQHHLAHIYASMLEFDFSGDYVGFSFDGTGYGYDSTLWGGEVFVNDERKYHFKPIKLLGADKAIKEPRRIALSMFFDRYDVDAVLGFDLPFTNLEIKLLHKSYMQNLNAPKSSSLGRLFDGVASLAGLCDFQTYEGEAGLLCEMAYDKKVDAEFDFFVDADGVIDIDFDLFDKDIVSKFINTLATIIIHIAKKESFDVILTGGVFQNKILLELVIKRLKEQGIKYYHQQQTPINDAGISLGQIGYFLKNQL
jgi:hydrogenase maturation protein HypF